MAKTEKKNHSELKLLRERIRDLEKEVRRLKKENSYHKKHQHMFEESQEDDSTEQPEIEVIPHALPDCPDCGKGILRKFEIVGRVFLTCEICDYRKKV